MEGCLCRKAALWPLRTSQLTPAQPLHEMRCSSVLEKCEVKGHEHAVQACCDRPHMCLVTSSYEPTLETKTFIEKSSSIAHTSACVKENFKRADSHRAPW